MFLNYSMSKIAKLVRQALIDGNGGAA